MKKIILGIWIFLEIIILISCSTIKTDAKETLINYLNCYNTNDIIVFNTLSQRAYNIEDLKNVNSLEVLKMKEIKGKRLNSAIIDSKNFQFDAVDIAVFSVTYDIDFIKEAIEHDGKKQVYYYLYKNNEENWIIYNHGVN